MEEVLTVTKSFMWKKNYYAYKYVYKDAQTFRIPDVTFIYIHVS